MDGGEASSYYADSKDDPSHPDSGAKPAHDEVRRAIKDDVRYIEEGEGGGDIVRRQSQHGDQVVSDICIHCLCQANVRADGRAEEVQDPERYYLVSV